MIGDQKPGAEYLEVTKKDFPFFEIKAGKLQPRYNFFVYLFRIPLGFWQSLRLLLKIKPDLIFSFGGYLAVPVSFSAFALGIPVVTHEQTTVAGSANKAIAKIAKKVFISFESSAKYFPQDKVVFTGLPLREEIFKSSKKLFSNSKKTVYITGGKQGSHIINEAVFEVLPQLLDKFNVIHQCGSTTLFNDIKKAKEIKESLGEKEKNYLVQEYFFEEEIGAVFDTADLVISRAGAHTVYELMMLKKPAILIPIPWAAQNEQLKNAQMLSSLGLAEILPEEKLPRQLLPTILNFDKKLGKTKNTHSGNKNPADLSAASIILQELEYLLK
jgi:UDP-N-acetylglucosamine--N-acetylmuramyl-(pentapeptide) pyrophosphoryl-undecaprenol N-acetylglucosamine transferase